MVSEIKRFLLWFDWRDVSGMILIYAIITIFFLGTLYFKNQIIGPSMLFGLVFLLLLANACRRKLAWGYQASYMLWFLVLAMIGTPAFALYQQVKPRRKT